MSLDGELVKETSSSDLSRERDIFYIDPEREREKWTKSKKRHERRKEREGKRRMTDLGQAIDLVQSFVF